MNTSASWPEAKQARKRVLEIQAKLHRFTRHLVESRMRGNAHVRFGGRAGETHVMYAAQGAPVRPYYVKAW